MSFTGATHSEAMGVLRYFLNNTTAQELQTSVLSALSHQTLFSKDVEDLLAALERLGIVPPLARTAISETHPRHCVRCHNPYVERDNGLRACRIPHTDLQLTVPTVQANSATGTISTTARTHVQRKFSCCNAPVGVDVTVQGMHFVGRHTTLTANVVYNAINVKTCGERGCNATRPVSQQ
ncbi:hypothetical protein BJ138DRAFT_1153461 [Hygrophoropsis aurantiaca]|uniref:Uncharacterized protein n=1 Tax=Hygrophoropsis aurantiaca TaxID=72124 RepID=A0ACB8AA86_9AGAM|nr:hypothetical protein BJ138DRAFT_1153461 [Hygrophoropsis aurantiaca]